MSARCCRQLGTDVLFPWGRLWSPPRPATGPRTCGDCGGPRPALRWMRDNRHAAGRRFLGHGPAVGTPGPHLLLTEGPPPEVGPPRTSGSRPLQRGGRGEGPGPTEPLSAVTGAMPPRPGLGALWHAAPWRPEATPAVPAPGTATRGPVYRGGRRAHTVRHREAWPRVPPEPCGETAALL